MDYDRIMVLENGHIIEFDTQRISADEYSVFHSMARMPDYYNLIKVLKI